MFQMRVEKLFSGMSDVISVAGDILMAVLMNWVRTIVLCYSQPVGQ